MGDTCYGSSNTSFPSIWMVRLVHGRIVRVIHTFVFDRSCMRRPLGIYMRLQSTTASLWVTGSFDHHRSASCADVPPSWLVWRGGLDVLCYDYVWTQYEYFYQHIMTDPVRSFRFCCLCSVGCMDAMPPCVPVCVSVMDAWNSTRSRWTTLRVYVLNISEDYL